MLGFLASSIRAGIAAQVREPQIHAFFRDVQESKKSIGGPHYFYSAPDSTLVVHSNWCRSHLFHVTNFHGAVVPRPAKNSKRSGTYSVCGRPVASYTERLGVFRAGLINAFITMGQDMKGNYWIMGRTGPVAWRHIEQQIAFKEPVSLG